MSTMIDVATSALPFFGGDDHEGSSSDHHQVDNEDDGGFASTYESFAVALATTNKKGACRKCGCIAYFKRKCQRCHRKFCNTCAPNSLQRYGENPNEECCIGCEPFLIVTPAESEPILEMEPESEEIFLLNTIHTIHNDGDGDDDDNNNNDNSNESLFTETSSSTPCNNNRRKGPIHVPLSATCCAVEEKDAEPCTNDSSSNCKYMQSPTVFHDSSTTATTTPTTVDSSQSNWRKEEEEEEEAGFLTSSGNFFSSAAGASPVDFLGLPSWLYNNNNNNNNHDGDDQDDPATATASSTAIPDPAAQQSPVADTTENAIATTPGRQHHNNKQQQEQEVVYRTPESNRKTRGISALYCGGVGSSSSSSSSIPQTPLTPESGCCTACQVYSTGKSPCKTCGTKYCSERRCQNYLYDNGTCAKCCRSRRKLPELPIPKDAGCCTSCQQFAIGKIPCKSCGAKFCQEVACQTYLFDDGTCVVCHGNI